MKRAVAGAVLVATIFFSSAASSDTEQQTHIDLLASAKSIRVKLREGFSTQWKNNKPFSKKEDWKAEFLIDSIDIENKTARMIGNQAAGNCIVMATPEAFNFLDQSPSGNLFLLTIFPSPNEDGSYPVVYSRHMNLAGPLPSQYYGSAEILLQTN